MNLIGISYLIVGYTSYFFINCMVGDIYNGINSRDEFGLDVFYLILS